MTPPDLLALAKRPAELVLVAGPNGSGKTTIAEAYIQPRFPLWPKINADRLLLALERTSLAVPDRPEIQAAQLVDATATCLALLREPFVLETVLSSDKYKRLIPIARDIGLIFRLVYVTTATSDINVERVRQRVIAGGHDVPEDRIHARWLRSMDNLEWFAARADRLVVADNSGPSLVVLALRHLGGALELHERTHPASERLRPLSGLPVLDAREVAPAR
jgi:predicted ABC-type ATPase